MEKEITGIQKGTGSYINEYMLSLTNSIKEGKIFYLHY